MMRRPIRLLVTLSFLVTALVATAQPQATVPRIGWLAFGFPPPDANRQRSPFFQGLRELGWVEGQNVAIEPRYAEERATRLPDLAAELVQRQVDVMLAMGPGATLRAARQATRTLPIVMAVDDDPLALGYIAGLPRPGGQITVLFLQHIEITGKCLELLTEALPQVTRVAVLWDAISAAQFRAAEAAARVLGVQLQSLERRDQPADEYASALEAAAREGAETLLVLRSPRFGRDRDRIIALAAQHRLPIMSGTWGLPEAGALMSYGADSADLYRRAATYVDKILKGAQPADLPVEQATTFGLVINLKTPKALGLTIPQTLLFQVDEVIR